MSSFASFEVQRMRISGKRCERLKTGGSLETFGITGCVTKSNEVKVFSPLSHAFNYSEGPTHSSLDCTTMRKCYLNNSKTHSKRAFMYW